MSFNEFPRYWERPGEQVFGPPYVAEDATLRLFFVDADVDALDALVDDSLNRVVAPSGTRTAFRATGQPIMFMLAQIERMYSQANDYLRLAKAGTPPQGVDRHNALTGRPYVRETELGVWVPVSRLVYGRPTPGFYLPFVFNDSPASVVTGREVYGYPKQSADFDFEVAGEMTMRTWHQTDGSGAEYTNSNLIAIDWTAATTVSQPTDFREAIIDKLTPQRDSTRPRLRFQDPYAPPSAMVEHPPWQEFVTAMVRNAPLFFLRQFRDPVDPMAATLQQIIQARFIIQRTPTCRVEQGATITFESSRTLDLLALLGITANERVVDVGSTIVIEALDFTVDLGKVTT